MQLAVSILVSNYDEEQTISRVNETSADYLHVDVTDGHFVPSITPKRQFLHNCTKPLDVHLMVSSPFSYISRFASLNTETIVIQVEIEDDIRSLLEYIRSLGIKCGLALSPDTLVTALDEYFYLIDQVIILTVTPGMGGQKINENCLKKIDELKKIREEKGLNFKIMVDGGINDQTVDKVRDADIIVVGSFICQGENFQEQIDKLGL